MDKSIIFLLGVVAGAIGGSTATYFIVKDKIENEAAEIIEQYAQHCEDRISKFSREEDSEEVSESEVEEPDNELDKNEGVKKYHKDLTSENTYKKEIEKVTEGEKALVAEKEGKIVVNKPYEITEEQYSLEAQQYDKITLEYYCEDDMLMCTEPEEMAETFFNVGREELIGEVWRLGQDWIPEGKDAGAVYVRNDNMSIDFEVIVYDKSWYEISGEGVE